MTCGPGRTRLSRLTELEPSRVAVRVSDNGQLQLYHLYCTAEEPLLHRSEILTNLLRDIGAGGSGIALLPISSAQFQRWRAAVHAQVGDIQHWSTASYLDALLAADALVDDETIHKLCEAMRGPLHWALNIPHPFPQSQQACDQVPQQEEARFCPQWAVQVLSTLHEDLAIRLIRTALLPNHHSGHPRHLSHLNADGITYPNGLFRLTRSLWTTIIHAWWPCIDATGAFAVTVAARNRRGALPAAHAIVSFRVLRHLTLDCQQLDSATMISLPWEFRDVATAACRLPQLESLRVLLGPSAKFVEHLARVLPEAARKPPEAPALTSLCLHMPAESGANDPRLSSTHALEAAMLKLTELKTLELHGGFLPGLTLTVHLTRFRALHTLVLATLMPADTCAALMHAATQLPLLTSITLGHCLSRWPLAPGPLLTHSHAPMHAPPHRVAPVPIGQPDAKGFGGDMHGAIARPPAPPTEPYRSLASAVGRIGGLREFILHKGPTAEGAGGRLPQMFTHELCWQLAAGCRGLTRLEIVDTSKGRPAEGRVGLFQGGACDAAAVGGLLEAAPELVALRLEGIRIDAGGAAALSRGLSAATNLQSLTLSVPPPPGMQTRSLEPQHAACLLDAVCRLPALRSLTLAHLRGCTAAAAAALSFATSLEHLGLSNWRMTGDQMATLAPALAALPALTSLHVSRNFLAEAGAQALEGVMHASAATRCDAPLRELALEQNCMRADASAAHLAAGLRAVTALTRLSLSGNRFTAAGAAMIAAALCGRGAAACTCPVAGPGARRAAAPAEARQGSVGLRELMIRQEWFDPRGIEDIAKAAEAMDCITEVDVRGQDECGESSGGDGDVREQARVVVDNVRAMKPGMVFRM